MAVKNDKNLILNDPYMHKCAICGKSVYVPCPDLWTYKRVFREGDNSYYKWFCSYHCVREYDREKDRKKTSGRYATQRC